MKSLTLTQRINDKIDYYDVSPIMEYIDSCLSSDAFESKQEFKQYLGEGALLHIGKIASSALAVPYGEYIVTVMNSGNTMLVPSSTISNTQDVFEHSSKTYEVFTKDLVDNWNLFKRTLKEFESDDSPNENLNTSIHTGSVDRTQMLDAMLDKGETVSSLADKCGVDAPAISRILREPQGGQGDPGGRNPSIGLAAKIAEILRLDVEALFPDLFGTRGSSTKPKQSKGNRGSGGGKDRSGIE